MSTSTATDLSTTTFATPWFLHDDPAPVVTLENGLRIANLSSPHPFQFEDGTVLPACSEFRCKELSAIVTEEVAEAETAGGTKFQVLDLGFELGEVLELELRHLSVRDDIDVILGPLPIVQAAKGYYPKLFSVRMADRVKKVACCGKFCRG
jgi:hypothetical protein